jgi:ATP-binding protein involved in chromosome partitioning
VTPSTESDVTNTLKSIELEQFDRPIGEIGRVAVSEAGPEKIRATVKFGLPIERDFAGLRERLERTLVEATGVRDVAVELSTDITAHGVQRNLKPLAAIRNVIAVASGKGGVGKSTVAVNLALALAADGARVGILDADIYGPSQPHMLGLVGEQPISNDGKTMQPLESCGLQVMSIGFLVNPDQPMVWRGPMVTSALNQLLHQTEWRDLDYLIVDMPPGTGDIQLTLSQQVPVSGAVIVTTPQDIAAIDAR